MTDSPPPAPVTRPVPDPVLGTRIDSLDPPPDLGTARARLRAQLAVEADRGPIVHLHPGRQSGRHRPGRSGGGTGTGPSARWPVIPEGPATLVADCVLWEATWADLRHLAAAIGRDQVLWFLEPTAEVGWRRLAHRAGRPLWRRAAGHDFERDLPAELRAAGIEVSELNRFGIGPAGIRSYALGRAEHIRT